MEDPIYRDFPEYRDILVNIIGVIFGEFWEAESILEKIANESDDLKNKIIESKATELIRLIEKFKKKLDYVRDLFEEIPIKRTNKDNPQ